MPLPRSDRLPHTSRRSASIDSECRIVGLISIEESYACELEVSGREVPWEALLTDLRDADRDSLPPCDQVVADIDRLARELAAAFAAIRGRQ